MSSKIQQDLTWLRRGRYRSRVLEQVAQFEGKKIAPDQVRTLTGIGLEEGTSAYGNGRLAILGLLERNFLINDTDQPRRYALRVNWNQVSVYSDWLEEHGMQRLDVEALRK
jgi:hypothetical protein